MHGSELRLSNTRAGCDKVENAGSLGNRFCRFASIANESVCTR